MFWVGFSTKRIRSLVNIIMNTRGSLRNNGCQLENLIQKCKIELYLEIYA